MSAEDKKSTIPVSIPKWEAELWSYVSSGDGEHCPLRNRCQTRKACSWCPDENKELLTQLLDNKRLNVDSIDFIESDEGGRLGRPLQLVEKLALKYLRMANVHRPPVSTELVALFDEEHSIEVRQLPLKVYHGAIWLHKDEWVIQVKDSDAAPTMRFTVFHEAFHILAHSRTSPVFRKRGLMIGSFNEVLAEYFAASILMPREWVVEKWAEVEDLDRMIEIFAVPRSAMCIKLRQLGLI